MNLKKLVLHIGLGKTGTTYIQSRLNAYRKDLIAHGFLYPSHGQASDGSHNDLMLRGMPKNPYVKYDQALVGYYFKKIVEEVDENIHTVVISSECSRHILLNSCKFKVYHDFFSNFQVDVVCYLRSPGAFMESRYKQFIKDGALPPEWDFKKFLSLRHSDCDFSWLYELEMLPFINKVHVQDYDESKSFLFDSFLSCAGIDFLKRRDEPGGNKSVVNLSLSCLEVEVLRLLKIYKVPISALDDFYFKGKCNELKYLSDEMCFQLNKKYNYDDIIRHFQ